MQVNNRTQCLHEVKLGLLLLHPSHFSQQVEQLSSVAELHHKHQKAPGFEGCFEFGDERVFTATGQNSFFVIDDVGFVIGKNVFLVDHFHRHEFAEAPDQEYFGEAATSDTLDDLEVVQIVVVMNWSVLAALQVEFHLDTFY